MSRKKLLNKCLDEIKEDLDRRVISAYDCMAMALEEFEARIIQANSKGHTPVRIAQKKIRELLNYLSHSENPLRISERDDTYFREMYSNILDRYHLDLDEHGIVKGARAGRFIKSTPSSRYSRRVIECPFRSFGR